LILTDHSYKLVDCNSGISKQHYVQLIVSTFLGPEMVDCPNKLQHSVFIYKCVILGGTAAQWVGWRLVVRVQLKCDGTRRRTGGEVKGKLTNGVGSQYPSHYIGTWCIQHYYRWCAHLGCQQTTELTPHADLNGLVRFAEWRNLVSARVPSHFKRSLHFHRLCFKFLLVLRKLRLRP